MSVRAIVGIVGFWLLVGLAYVMSFHVDALRFDTGFQLTVGKAVLFMGLYGAWAPLTFLLFARLDAPIRARLWHQVALVGVGGFLVWQPMFIVFDAVMGTFVSDRPFPGVGKVLWNTRSTVHFFHAVLYLVVFATCALLTYQRRIEQTQLAALSLSKRNAEAERDLTAATLRVLQARLSPHFLFNCLNSISGLARGGESQRVVNTIAQLGDLLRFAIEASERPLVSVREEIDFLVQYAGLQKLRFGDRFQLDLDAAPSALSCECPPFVLQSLIENVFTHEVSHTTQRVRIEVEIRRGSGRLVLSVTNSCANPENSETQSSGLGTAMQDLRRRLDLLYAGRAEISSRRDVGLYRAEVSLPDGGPEA